MKKLLALILAVVLTFPFTACSNRNNTSINNNTNSTVSQEERSVTEKTKSESEEMNVCVNIGDKKFSATLENNAAAKEFYNLIKADGLTVKMSDYSGFEKVGALGKTLTSNDTHTTAKPGDIVLYQSNQIVMFYGSNSWSYTRLGRIDDVSGWEKALGSGDITAVFTLSE